MSERGVKKEKTVRSTLDIFIIGTAIAFILIGLAVIFLVDDYMSFQQLCYIVDAVVLIAGIVMIVLYFLRESYKNIHEYGFSIGVFLVMIGVVMFVRTNTLGEQDVIFLLGALMLFASVFKLQNALDLRAMRDRSFWLWLILAVGFAVMAIIILAKSGSGEGKIVNFTKYVLVVDGIFSLVGIVYLSFRVKRMEKQGLAKEETSGEPETDDVTRQENTQAQEDADTVAVQMVMDSGMSD